MPPSGDYVITIFKSNMVKLGAIFDFPVKIFSTFIVCVTALVIDA